MGFNRLAPGADSTGHMFFTVSTGENSLEGGITGHETFIRGTDHPSSVRATLAALGDGSQYAYSAAKTAPPLDATIVGGGVPVTTADSGASGSGVPSGPGVMQTVLHPTSTMTTSLVAAGQTVVTYAGVILLAVSLVLLGVWMLGSGGD